MENKTSSQTEPKTWFSDVSWKAGLILALIAFISGGTGGTAIVASKAVKAEGITQDQADVRYLSKEEAEKRSEKRDKQLDRIEQKIETQQNKLDKEQNEQMKVLYQILENQRNVSNP